jgi:hypothetical protein
MLSINVNCPECDEEIIFAVDKDNNYGADADGNRGMVAYFSELDYQKCSCDLHETDIDRLGDEAVEIYRETY